MPTFGCQVRVPAGRCYAGRISVRWCFDARDGEEASGRYNYPIRSCFSLPRAVRCSRETCIWDIPRRLAISV